jgi:N-acyl-L-homoserine lactone synthetase
MVALAFAPGARRVASGLSDRVDRLLERVDFRRADEQEDREAIFRLRYAAYVREGAIPSHPSQRFTDKFDEADNAWIFGIFIDGELASSIRLHVAFRAQPAIPALDVFADILAPEIARGRTVIDPTRFVADKIASRRNPELCYVTTRLAILGSEYFHADLLLATVRAEHQAFYRRVFGHKLICDPRHYPSLTKPISLMALDYPLARERLMQRHPFLRSTVFERHRLFARAPQPLPALRPAA